MFYSEQVTAVHAVIHQALLLQEDPPQVDHQHHQLLQVVLDVVLLAKTQPHLLFVTVLVISSHVHMEILHVHLAMQPATMEQVRTLILVCAF